MVQEQHGISIVSCVNLETHNAVYVPLNDLRSYIHPCTSDWELNDRVLELVRAWKWSLHNSTHFEKTHSTYSFLSLFRNVLAKKVLNNVFHSLYFSVSRLMWMNVPSVKAQKSQINSASPQYGPQPSTTPDRIASTGCRKSHSFPLSLNPEPAIDRLSKVILRLACKVIHVWWI
jgi:hypothetical protein